MEVLLDASAIMAVIANEPEREFVINNTQDSVIVSPNIISFEITNGLTRMMRKKIIDSKEKMINLIKNFKKMPIKVKEIDIERVLEIAWKYKIYAYDACYLETAKRLNLPLLTFDSNMKRVGNDLGINIIGGFNVNF
jgi:predicted nucleic acid-binding protein